MSAIPNMIRAMVKRHQDFIQAADVAMSYYLNKNDILRVRPEHVDREIEKRLTKNPLRNADNRISHNWHQLLVDQKTSYAFTYPPTFDTGVKANNERLAELLGDDFTRYCKDLCVDAANTGTAWVHYWLDEAGAFQFAPVPAVQVIGIYNTGLKRKLIAAIRCYRELDDQGEEWERYEYWTERELRYYSKKATEQGEEIAALELQFTGADGVLHSAHVVSHPFGVVPFVEFPNNKHRTGDLAKYKSLIDLYDKIISGFANDLEDIQEVIFLLKNYGRESLSEMLENLRLFKAVKLEGGEDGSGGLDTLTIEIPVEARKVALEILRRQIFVSGQGVDPDPERFGNASGVALKFLYSLLEMKVGMMETEFRSGFNDLVRAVLQHAGISQVKPIIHTYTRAAINNELENAQVARQLMGIASEHTIIDNLFWVDDTERELERLKAEREQAMSDDYGVLEQQQPEEVVDDKQ